MIVLETHTVWTYCKACHACVVQPATTAQLCLAVLATHWVLLQKAVHLHENNVLWLRFPVRRPADGDVPTGTDTKTCT